VEYHVHMYVHNISIRTYACGHECMYVRTYIMCAFSVHIFMFVCICTVLCWFVFMVCMQLSISPCVCMSVHNDPMYVHMYIILY
jgi:hypothetical protein